MMSIEKLGMRDEESGPNVAFNYKSWAQNRLNCDIAQNPCKPRLCLFSSNFDLRIRWQICVWGMWSQGHVQHWMTHFKRKKQLKHINKHHCSKSLAPLSESLDTKNESISFHS
jgi:hypothetical protein